MLPNQPKYVMLLLNFVFFGRIYDATTTTTAATTITTTKCYSLIISAISSLLHTHVPVIKAEKIFFLDLNFKTLS
jgi:hypothetical protein